MASNRSPFMVMGRAFCLSTVFTLAKTLRDRHETDLSKTQVCGGMLGHQPAMHERAAAARAE